MQFHYCYSLILGAIKPLHISSAHMKLQFVVGSNVCTGITKQVTQVISVWHVLGINREGNSDYLFSISAMMSNKIDINLFGLNVKELLILTHTTKKNWTCFQPDCWLHSYAWNSFEQANPCIQLHKLWTITRKLSQNRTE